MASEDTITLELLGARLLALTADVRDLQLRFAGMETRLGALEARFSGMEARFAVQKERMKELVEKHIAAEMAGDSAAAVSMYSDDVEHAEGDAPAAAGDAHELAVDDRSAVVLDDAEVIAVLLAGRGHSLVLQVGDEEVVKGLRRPRATNGPGR